MTIVIESAADNRSAVIRRDHGEQDLAWNELTSLLQTKDPRVDVETNRVELSWLTLLGQVRSLAHIQNKYGIKFGYSATAEQLVRDRVVELRALEGLRDAPLSAVVAPEDIDTKLAARGWDLAKRRLTAEQRRDLARLLKLPHGANFSVPGSGKTTVLLATHLLSQPDDVGLLVVAPKNAFPAWDQALGETLAQPEPSFVRLVGGRRRIETILAENPKRLLITYSQLVRAVDVIADFLDRRRTHLVLDESHKIKAGRSVQAGLAVANIAPLAPRRDILSGTPMPNAVADLGPQLDFLYPSYGFSDQLVTREPRRVAGPFYVRTTKRELQLPPPVINYDAIEMSDAQRVLYGFAKDQTLRQMRGLNRRDVGALARSSVMRLLQAAIDPQAAARAVRESGDAARLSGDLKRVIDELFVEEISPRMGVAIELARETAVRGKKVVLWAPFTQTIQSLETALSDLGAQSIYGAVPSGDEDEDDTRESILKKFHEDPLRQVLVANPAAGGEGISLHRVCHDAIFVGRTYNAAHYLQARDRIHRLGLPPGTVTTIHILEAKAPGGIGSVDLSVRRRLDWKVDQMGRALDDVDLTQLALESADADPLLDDGLTFDDLADLTRELMSGTTK